MSALASLFIITGLAYGGYWVYQHQEDPRKPGHFIVLLDRSASLPPDPECRALAGLVEEIYDSQAALEDSTLDLMVTGDESTLYEPIAVATVRIPVFNRLVEGKEATQNQRRALLLELQAQCRQHNTPVLESAIVLGIERGIQQLTALGCQADSACRLLVRSDGRETIDPFFKESMDKGHVVERQAPKLDTSVVQVTTCGSAMTRANVASGKKKGKSAPDFMSNARLLSELWTQSVSHPRNLVQRPVCPGSTATALEQ
jgi:hypothetical protein